MRVTLGDWVTSLYYKGRWCLENVHVPSLSREKTKVMVAVAISSLSYTLSGAIS